MQIPMLHSAFTMTSPVKLGVSLGFNGLSASTRTGCCFHFSKGFSGWRQKWGLMQSSSTSEPCRILCFFCDRRVNAQTGLIQPGVTMPRRARKEKKKTKQTNTRKLLLLLLFSSPLQIAPRIVGGDLILIQEIVPSL